MPAILWAYRTTSRVSTGETPFNLVYGIEALIPMEVVVGSPRLNAYEGNPNTNNSTSLKENLDLVKEQRDKAATQLAAYHKRISIYYNS